MTSLKPDHDQDVLTGLKILVVDDEHDALTIISTILKDNGATVIQAQDGDEAIRLARKENPDLMTLDLAMPGKNGVDVLKAIRDDVELRELSVCIITGRPEMRKAIYEVRPGPDGYLDKPVDERTLIRNIRKIHEIKERKKARRGKE